MDSTLIAIAGPGGVPASADGNFGSAKVTVLRRDGTKLVSGEKVTSFNMSVLPIEAGELMVLSKIQDSWFVTTSL